MFDPFRKIALDGAKTGSLDVNAIATAAVAVGLALRKAGER
jgi:hypothetical protein